MQSTIREFRDLPNYPEAVVRAGMIYFFAYGVISIALGVPMLLKSIGLMLPLGITGILVSIGSIFSFLHNILPATLPNYLINPDLSRETQAQSFQFMGAIILIMGGVLLATAWTMREAYDPAKRKAITRNLIIWLIYAALSTVLFTIDIFYFSMAGMVRFDLSQISLLSVVFMIVIPALFLLLLRRDPRIQAYFGAGPYADVYRNWRSAWLYGVKDAPPPWTGEIAEGNIFSFSLPKTIPILRVTGLVLIVYHVLFGILMFQAARGGIAPPTIGVDARGVTALGDTVGFGAFFQPTLYSDVLWLNETQQRVLDVLAIAAVIIAIGIYIRHPYVRIPAIILNVILLVNWLLGDFSSYTPLTYIFIVLAGVTIVLFLLHGAFKAYFARTEQSAT